MGSSAKRVASGSVVRLGSAVVIFALLFGPAFGRAVQRLEIGKGPRHHTVKSPTKATLQKTEIAKPDLVASRQPPELEPRGNFLWSFDYQETLRSTLSFARPDALRGPPPATLL